MGKGDRRRKAKQAFADAVALAPVPKKQPNGRKRRTIESRDKSIGPLKARCRQMGIEVTRASIRNVRAPWWGCHAGRVIAEASMSEDERAALWDAICSMRRIVTAHDIAIGVPRRHAVCLRLLAPVDELSADAETPPKDERSEEEKARAATRNLMQLEGWLGYTDKRAASEAKRVVVDDMSCLDPDGLLSALRCVSDGLKGKVPKYRGRG